MSNYTSGIQSHFNFNIESKSFPFSWFEVCGFLAYVRLSKVEIFGFVHCF